MTLPKGYVNPNKEAEEKTRREAEEKTRREAEEKTRREAEEKTILQEPQYTPSVTNNLNSNRLDGNQEYIVKTLENNLNYYVIWEQLREAYLHTLKEATSSYFRLLDFWSQHKNYKE